jgi:hypothetical protein
MRKTSVQDAYPSEEELLLYDSQHEDELNLTAVGRAVLALFDPVGEPDRQRVRIVYNRPETD